MPYTLTKGLLWFLLALLIGVVVGWLLRSIRATSQLRAARHDSAELERLRGRVAELERAPVPEVEPLADPDVPGPSTPTGATATEPDVRAVDLGQATDTVGSVDVAGVADVAPRTDDATRDVLQPPITHGTESATVAETEPPVAARASPDTATPDTSGAAAVLGTPIEHDDLTAIDGIDAAIAGLCHSIGITTWAELADTEVSLLRTMLADAGPRVSAHRPDTWPQQARLLATGRWDEFRSLVASLHSGKLSE